jgi:enamine deaminase RidA (YjgF/YER057c/UK114 family)
MAKNSQVQFYHEAIERQLGFAAMVHSGNTLYLSGLVAVDEKMQVVGVGDMKKQIECIYDQMEQILAMSQATLANVVNEVMYTTNLAALVEANAARVARYAKYAPPASTGVQVSALFFPDALIEIQATAVLDKEFTR